MSELDLLAVDVLERDVPYRQDAHPDWRDVLARAGMDRARGPRRGSRRMALVACTAAMAAVAVGATPVGSAIYHGVGDFSAWLRGDPGTPALPDDQRAFEQENASLVFAFPVGTTLRELARTEVAGRGVRILGFRAPTGYCLRLESDAPGNAPPPSQCLSPSMLQRGPSVLLVAADVAIGAAKPVTRISYGFAADSVQAVEFVTEGGALAKVATVGNVFLTSSDSGPLERITAITRAGDRFAVPFAPALSTRSESEPSMPGGPAEVDRSVGPGRVAWIEQRERRGSALPTGKDRDYWSVGNPVFARVIMPAGDAAPGVIVALVQPSDINPFLEDKRLQLCTAAITPAGLATGGGCSPVETAFVGAPVLWGASQPHGSEQLQLVSGLASDEVASVKIYGGDGSQFEISLTDNVFAAAIPRTLFPVRLVARAGDGKVIYTKVNPGAG